MLSQLRPAFLMTVVLAAVTGLLYPLGITAVSQAVFREQANGSLISRQGVIIGSRLIGQNFTAPQYFHPRPSAAGTHGYDASASGGSNFGTSNPDLISRLRTDAAAYRSANGSTGSIPADAITASGSGLDPEISPANALLQSNRVARARGVDAGKMRAVVVAFVQNRQFDVLGEPRVNVLEMNLALDEQFPLRH